MPWLIPHAIPVPADFRGFNACSPAQHFTRYERHLPHFRLEGACYTVTFRLKDSIPAEVLAKLKREDDGWNARLAMKEPLSEEEDLAWQEFRRSRRRKIELVLDQGHGECLLRDPKQREVVIKALRHFEGKRCEMLCHTMMPNHVHALFRPLGKHQVQDLCGSWKSFTSMKIGKALRRTGGIWQEETFDRLIRDHEHHANVVRYIARNPLEAKLRQDEAAVWFCEAIRAANGWQAS